MDDETIKNILIILKVNPAKFCEKDYNKETIKYFKEIVKSSDKLYGNEDSIYLRNQYYKYLHDYCYKNIGLNTEILTLSNSAEYLKSNYNITSLSDLNKKHCIELGHIFQLGQYYSSNMNYTFKDSNNDNKPYFMGCYGIGVSRTLAAVCEQNCDEHGLIWPKNLAPYMISIVYQNNKTTEAFSLYDTLQNNNVDVLIDDRDISLGSKIKDSKLLGIPYLVIIGKNAKVGLYEVEERATGQKSYFSIDDLVKVVN